MKNNSGILPIEYKVLVQPVKVDDVTKGGIIIPDTSKDREQFAQMQGVLVAASPLAFSYENETTWDKPKPGDKVMFAKFAGASVKGKDGLDYRIINDKDVSAVLA